MNAILRQLVLLWGLTFLACLMMIAICVFYNQHGILVPRYRALAGLVVCFAITVAVFKGFGQHPAYPEQLFALTYVSFFLAIILVLVSFFFQWRHPMTRYANVRHVTSDEFVESDDIWRRDAPVVLMLEREGSRESDEGGWFGIERYLYSARTAVALGFHLADGNGSPKISYETSGLAAWLFGIRAACEEFTFFSINLTPISLAYLYYRHRKAKPSLEPFVMQPIHAFFLLTPFTIGLAPFLEP